MPPQNLPSTPLSGGLDFAGEPPVELQGTKLGEQNLSSGSQRTASSISSSTKVWPCSVRALRRLVPAIKASPEFRERCLSRGI